MAIQTGVIRSVIENSASPLEVVRKALSDLAAIEEKVESLEEYLVPQGAR